MDKLWAPWRIGYLAAKRKKGCIFCAAKRALAKNFVIVQGEYSFSLLNIFPYNNGHAMVCPLRHTGNLFNLGDEELLDMFRVLKKTQGLLDKALRPQGYNIGINIKEAAGAGIPGHLHIHLVPRWKSDVNFMPVVNNTKVISESLKHLYARLQREKDA